MLSEKKKVILNFFMVFLINNFHKTRSNKMLYSLLQSPRHSYLSFLDGHKGAIITVKTDM